MIPLIVPTKKIKKVNLPNGNYIKYYSKKEYVEEGIFIIVNYRMTYNKNGKIISIITNGHWETRRFDEQDRIIYYENSFSGEKKNISYHYDEKLKSMVKVEEHI